MRCKWVRFGYKVLPLSFWRAFLLERHLDHCPLCRDRILDDEAIRSMGTTASALQTESPLWPVPLARPETRTLRLDWRYAFGVFLAAVFFFGVVAVSRLFPPSILPEGQVFVNEAVDDACVFTVLKAKIGGEPARPIIFKPRQPGMTIVWFEKIEN